MKFQPKRKIYTISDAFEKMAAYCAREERCQSDIAQKLYAYGLNRDESDEVIAQLISESYLSESRFAKAYASGKFRIYKWGRLKIKAGLKQKGLSSYCIADGLSALDEDQYRLQLEDLIRAKVSGNAILNFELKQNTIRYALSKGYEPDLVYATMDLVSRDLNADE